MFDPVWYMRANARAKRLGVTQVQLAKALGVETRGAVGHYLTGRRQPSLSQVVALSNELGITLDEMLLQ